MPRDHNLDMPAFPRSWEFAGHNGISARDYFASQALAQCIAISERATAGRTSAPYSAVLKAVAKQAYEIADAMMFARDE